MLCGTGFGWPGGLCVGLPLGWGGVRWGNWWAVGATGCREVLCALQGEQTLWAVQRPVGRIHDDMGFAIPARARRQRAQPAALGQLLQMERRQACLSAVHRRQPV